MQATSRAIPFLLLLLAGPALGTGRAAQNEQYRDPSRYPSDPGSAGGWAQAPDSAGDSAGEPGRLLLARYQDHGCRKLPRLLWWSPCPDRADNPPGPVGGPGTDWQGPRRPAHPTAPSPQRLP